MKYSICAILAVLACLVFFSCNDEDCAVCPYDEEPVTKYYEVIYSYTAHFGGVPPFYALKYNSSTGDVVDSLNYGEAPFWDIDFSPDGETAYLTNFGATWIEDYGTGDTLAITTDHGGSDVEVSTDGNFLLVSGREPMVLFSLPDLSVLHTMSGIGLGVFHPQQKLVYFGVALVESLFVMDFQQLPPSIISVPLTDHDGFGVVPQELSVSPDGSRLFVNVGRTFVLVIDLNTLAIVQRFGDKSGADDLWDFAWHPDGRRLFMASNGGWEKPGGVIDVFDLGSGLTYRFIQQSDLELWPEPFSPASIEFTPDGQQLFVMCRSFDSGPFLRFNVATKELTAIMPLDHSTALSLGINPKARTS